MFYVDVYFVEHDAEQRKTTGPFTTIESAECFVRGLASQYGFKHGQITRAEIRPN